ncbi:hypothetical protein PHYBLDRAFT_147189 [Phycomyces blakesleeanus NRRL 1555(-)]|uniref:Uncharacterized protein n=1 Tax=Phycomyces blakesleeanus (strain ATCC 8743b / DSM 1359 / FGSC 10004 / NBRC 33097 / NRRL 1555) TaxID=763407 RepID=A0A167M9R0_PHYB8|nr:hypothetical protein PHYBLDRAFT_147189 [Phycomyces blakesleeanus NRRL 1555(-)]OAD72217.1 hypothetical protein PHYBLDRAFT_147189 [Phycomyces blakesleeanus NRRL 1555(-)]|eukprot:XP_018290257.1 hypothetical protein PHYBLDRAFT_147189 [Phycomyces blakesleeanus NRRL 1555(-)]
MSTGSGSSSTPNKISRSLSLCGSSSGSQPGVHPKIKKASNSTKYKHSGRPRGDLGGVPVSIRGGVCTRITKPATPEPQSG